MKPFPILALLTMTCLCGCPNEGEDAAVPASPAAPGEAPTHAEEDGPAAVLSDQPGHTPMAASDAQDAGSQAAPADGEAQAAVESDACCAAHAAPGCADQAIMDCVCADDVLPQCCTEAWTEVCVEIVRQRHCDPGVRECVCDDWEQSGCCDTDWTQNFCDVVATAKCEASVGCGP